MACSGSSASRTGTAGGVQAADLEGRGPALLSTSGHRAHALPSSLLAHGRCGDDTDGPDAGGTDRADEALVLALWPAAGT